jgi:hypothetical protein
MSKQQQLINCRTASCNTTSPFTFECTGEESSDCRRLDLLRRPRNKELEKVDRISFEKIPSYGKARSL